MIRFHLRLFLFKVYAVYELSHLYIFTTMNCLIHFLSCVFSYLLTHNNVSGSMFCQ